MEENACQCWNRYKAYKELSELQNFQASEMTLLTSLYKEQFCKKLITFRLVRGSTQIIYWEQFFTTFINFDSYLCQYRRRSSVKKTNVFTMNLMEFLYHRIQLPDMASN